MSIRQAPRAARGAAVAALAVILALTAAGCGSGGGSSGGPGTGSAAAGSPVSAAPSGALATIKGPDGIVLTIDSARREDGGFVTVTGEVHNTGSQPFTQAGSWRGDEAALQVNGGSLAGATLVDLAGGKRYYVLRDTAGRCLCTTGLTIIEPGATVAVYAQFPAPPTTTTQVDFEVPTLPSATIPLSR